MLTLNNVTKYYGANKEFTAVDKVSFSCPNGKITGLLGPNGAGKTTTLRMVSGLVKPDSGEVIVDGSRISEENIQVRSHLGIQSDMNGVYPDLTPREQFKFYGNLYGLSGSELEANIIELASILEITDILDRRASGFSLGQRQKIVLGRALLHKPNNLLLDEPTNGLDVTSVSSIRTLIQDLKTMGRTILMSTHYMDEAERLCDYTHIIVKGKIIASGSPEELKDKTNTAKFEDAVLYLLKGGELIDCSNN